MKRIFQTENDVVIMQGEAALGLEAAVLNTIDPGDKVLMLNSGPFGNSLEPISKMGGKIVELSCPINESIEPQKLKDLLDAEADIKAMTVVHCETPRGS